MCRPHGTLEPAEGRRLDDGRGRLLRGDGGRRARDPARDEHLRADALSLGDRLRHRRSSCSGAASAASPRSAAPARACTSSATSSTIPARTSGSTPLPDPAQPARRARVHQPDLGGAARAVPPRRAADPHPRRSAALLGFVGVLIVAQPGSTTLGPGHAAALIAAVCFALNTIFTKQIMRHDSVLCVIFWMTLLQGLASLLLSLPGGIPAPSAATAPWLARRRRDRPHRALLADLRPRPCAGLDRGADGVRPPAARSRWSACGSMASRSASPSSSARR